MEILFKLRRSTYKGNTDAMVASGINYIQTAIEQETSLLVFYSVPIQISRRSGSTTSLIDSG